MEVFFYISSSKTVLNLPLLKPYNQANELQEHFLKLCGIIVHILLAQDKRVHKLISSLSPLTPIIGILEFNPCITGILKLQTLKPLIPWKHPD